MFQKVQNAYLAVAAVLLLPVHYLSLWSASFDHITDDNFESCTLIVKQHLSVDIPLLSAVVLCVLAVFLFPKPRIQAQLIKAAFLSIVVFGLSAAYVIHNLKIPLAPNQNFQQEYKLTLLLPIAAIVLLILSLNEFWKKEEVSQNDSSNLA
jgi:hypothetical protein